MDAEQGSRWWLNHATRPGVRELEEVTRAHWDGKQPAPGATAAERLQWYIETLLPEELCYADEKRQALHRHPCQTLALLVGHSPEPLLQAIGVFQPRRVVLLLNQYYGAQKGEQRGDELKGWIERWLAPRLPEPLEAIDLCVVADRPDAVFHALCDRILPDRQRGWPVIVDITGAKKSMVAGAFLFAAYGDIPISYVDFDDYDEKHRRPFGFNCRIGTLANPYDAFRLREWERVQRMYEHYHFRAAADTLAGILDDMRRLPQASPQDAFLYPFRPEDAQAAELLLQVVRFYAAWDDGDYFQAGQLLRNLQQQFPTFSPPVAVTSLGQVWPHPEDSSNAEGAALQLLDRHDELRMPPQSIFESNELLVTYARDELAKIERLVDANEDNRSALLRAAGLDELLLKARLVRLWHADREGWIGLWEQDERPVGRCRTLEQETQHKLYEALVNHQSTDYMRQALQRRPTYDRKLDKSVPAFVKLDIWWASYRARPTREAPRLGHYDRRAGLSGETLTRLRNQAIHMYLCVTQPVAQAAVGLARANLDEFEANWVGLCGPAPTLTGQDVERLPWDDVCRLCRLDFLPLASQHSVTT